MSTLRMLRIISEFIEIEWQSFSAEMYVIILQYENTFYFVLMFVFTVGDWGVQTSSPQFERRQV